MLVLPPRSDGRRRRELPVDGGAAGARGGPVLRGRRSDARTARTARRSCSPTAAARIWLTTSRRSVKARAWRRRPVDRRAGPRTAISRSTFTGTVKTYDALDKRTWGAAVAGATSIARATAGFSRKNARFFAGYAFDARQVPLAWTPPGRVFVGIDLERTALLDDEGVQEGRGRWGGEERPRIATFRRSSTGADPLGRPPRRRGLADRPGGQRRSGGCRRAGPRRRSRSDGAPRRTRSTPRSPPRPSRSPAPIPTRRSRSPSTAPSVWRARDMVGAMFQGVAESFVEGSVGSGAKTLRAIARRIWRRPPTPSSASRRAASCGGRAGRAGARTRDDERPSTRSRSTRRPRPCGRSRATRGTSRTGTGTSSP